MKGTHYNSNAENDDQLLSDALIAEGNPDQAALLTGGAEKLTRRDIIDFLNGKGQEKRTDPVEASLSKITNIRVEKGQSIVPWKDIDDEIANMPEKEGENMKGGIW